MRPQNHEKQRFGPPKNQVMYHKKKPKHVGFGGPGNNYILILYLYMTG